MPLWDRQTPGFPPKSRHLRRLETANGGFQKCEYLLPPDGRERQQKLVDRVTPGEVVDQQPNRNLSSQETGGAIAIGAQNRSKRGILFRNHSLTIRRIQRADNKAKRLYECPKVFSPLRHRRTLVAVFAEHFELFFSCRLDGLPCGAGSADDAQYRHFRKRRFWYEQALILEIRVGRNHREAGSVQQ